MVTLTSHALVGATVASLIPQHPVLGFCAAFMSHFIIDAIPHWDYPIASGSIDPLIGKPMKYDKSFFVDTVRIGTDILLGFGLVIFALGGTHPLSIIILGACGGILPDPLQFAYAHFRHEPLVSLQRFHLWIHTEKHLENAKGIGILSQILFIALVVGIGKFLP